jgi:hypothetical protein
MLPLQRLTQTSARLMMQRGVRSGKLPSSPKTAAGTPVHSQACSKDKDLTHGMAAGGIIGASVCSLLFLRDAPKQGTRTLVADTLLHGMVGALFGSGSGAVMVLIAHAL